MGAIYERCSSCLIYLGEESSEIAKIFADLQVLGTAFHQVEEGLFRPTAEISVKVGSSHGELDKGLLIDFLYLPWFQ